MASSVRINPAALNNFLSRKVQPYLVKKAEEIASEARANAPQGTTGELRNSIIVERTPNNGVIVKATSSHAGYVHQGTGPGHIPDARPNYFPLIRKGSRLFIWSDANNADPFKVARGIAAHGTKANPFLEEAVQRVLGSSKFRWINKELKI